MGGMDDAHDGGPAERDPFDLDRFVTAQDTDDTYATALGELRRGRKRSHWMWFVFPQVSGLGRSAVAKHFELTGADEARAYLAHPVLGPRLLECARAMAGLAGHDAVAVLGPVDAAKLRSSMTLFGYVDQDPVFTEVLDRYFDGQRDEETLRRL
jgi:uncharacterized protein (DUF1810 family)